MWKNGGDPQAIVNTQGLTQVSDEEAIKAAVDEVIKASPKVVDDYKRGNARALGALVGPVMKRLGNKANPAIVNRILSERIA
jgi:aspartyl-tRNA(Asn)/glutamyl-tRNA(Gln) amidotransferase subunit B